MRIEKLTRHGKEFAVLSMDGLKKLMDDAEMLADVKAYDAAKARIERGDDELIPLEITERRLAGEAPSGSGVSFVGSPKKTWRRHPACPAP
jgi:hypothetical protein